MTDTKNALFTQICAMMTVCGAAKAVVAIMESQKNKEATPEFEKLFNGALVNLATFLQNIDFPNGDAIVEGASQACDLHQPGVDIYCSGFMVGMPQKSKNPDKMCFVRGRIGKDKGAVIMLTKKDGEELVKGLNNCLDTLHPGRLTGVEIPKLILHS